MTKVNEIIGGEISTDGKNRVTEVPLPYVIIKPFFLQKYFITFIFWTDFVSLTLYKNPQNLHKSALKHYFPQYCHHNKNVLQQASSST